MTREEAIELLENTAFFGRSQDDIDTAIEMAIKALEQEPCEDAISRKAVLENAINVPIAKIVTEDKVICRKVIFADDIEKLPSVTPQQRTGRWIDAEVLDNIRAEIETDLSHFCFDEWGNENPTWKEIKAIIGKYKAESEAQDDGE